MLSPYRQNCASACQRRPSGIRSRVSAPHITHASGPPRCSICAHEVDAPRDGRFLICDRCDELPQLNTVGCSVAPRRHNLAARTLSGLRRR